MQSRDFSSPILQTVLLLSIFFLPGCTNRGINLINPQSGATFECSGSGFGLGTAWVQGYIDDCVRRSEGRGYVPIDKLTSEQRADLESRGVLPKSSGAATPPS